MTTVIFVVPATSIGGGLSRLVNKNHCFVLGKGYGEPVALEGALKLKEMTYIHAEGYSGGALKHGPFALIDGPDVSGVADVGERQCHITVECCASHENAILLRSSLSRSAVASVVSSFFLFRGLRPYKHIFLYKRFPTHSCLKTSQYIVLVLLKVDVALLTNTAVRARTHVWPPIVERICLALYQGALLCKIMLGGTGRADRP